MLASSCISKDELKPVIPIEFLNDSNTKVWQMQFAESYWFYRGYNTIIFDAKGRFSISPKNNLDPTIAKVGKYNLFIKQDKTYLRLDFEGKGYLYEASVFSKNSMIFIPQKKQDQKADPVRLIPFQIGY